MSLITQRSSQPPLLCPKAMANGTIPAGNLAESRAFYEEVLGLEVIEHSPGRLVLRLGGKHTYLVEEMGEGYTEMVLLNHNGLYLDPAESVDDAYARVASTKERYGIRALTKPMWQHGSYAFFLQDRDGNWWEFYHERTGDRRDLTGGPQMSPDEVRDWFAARRAMDEANGSRRVSPVNGSGVVGASALSHGTLESSDLHATRRFYEEVLGLTVRQLVPVSIHIDTRDGYMYAAVHAPNAAKAMPVYYRNTLIFDTREDIDRAHAAVLQAVAEYDIQEVTTPESSADRYFFRLRDLDGNWWELARDIHGGYHGIGDVTGAQ